MNYAEIAKQSRIKCLELVYAAQTSHIGSLFSCADIMAVIFEKIDLDKDKFVLSAGWKACMLYYHLWRKGRITLEELDSYCQKTEKCSRCRGQGETAYDFQPCEKCGGDGKGMSKFIGLAEPIHKDITIAGGSMQIGFVGAVGLALAKKIKKEEGIVYCLISDGEMAGGMIYEGALIAAHHDLNNLVVIVDVNGFSAMGRTEDILSIEPIQDKWASWGWEYFRGNGHDAEFIHKILNEAILKPPTVIIAETVKGKGWKRAENNNLYHYKTLSKEEYQEAVAELQS